MALSPPFNLIVDSVLFFNAFFLLVIDGVILINCFCSQETPARSLCINIINPGATGKTCGETGHECTLIKTLDQVETNGIC